MVESIRLRHAGHKQRGREIKNSDACKHEISVRKRSQEEGFYKAIACDSFYIAEAFEVSYITKNYIINDVRL
jgi:hypothetical protein